MLCIPVIGAGVTTQLAHLDDGGMNKSTDDDLNERHGHALGLLLRSVFAACCIHRLASSRVGPSFGLSSSRPNV